MVYNPKEGNPSWKVSISINFGVLEYWSVGVMVKGLIPFLSTLQYSITPVLQGQDFQKLFATFKLSYLLVLVPNLYNAC